MENKELELIDMLGYIPWDLRFIMPNKEIATLSGVYTCGNYVEIWAFIYPWGTYSTDRMTGKPILRPMSDLTKSINIKGYNNDKSFIPIEIIAKLFGIHNGSVEGNLWGYDVPILDDYQDCYFGWDTNWFYYFVVYNDEISCTGDTLEFKQEIYDLLNQWHFDYRGLIDRKLAIDINTIEQTKGI